MSSSLPNSLPKQYATTRERRETEDEDRKGRLGFIKKWEMHDTFREVQNSSNDQLKSN